MTSRAMAAFALALVMTPLVVAAAILLTLPSRGGATGARERPAATATASPTAVAVDVGSPSPTAAAPSPTATPEPTADATPTPQAETVQDALGDRAELRLGGQTIGTIAAVGYKHRTTGGDTVLAVKVTYEMTEDFTYSYDDWSARSEDGDVYDLAEDQLAPALGDGTAEAGEDVSRFLTFDVPRRGAARYVVYAPAGAETVIEVDLED